MSFARPTIPEIKAIAVDRLEDILGALVPGGHCAGKCYMAPNPTRGRQKTPSFVVWISGPVRGAFTEYVNKDEEKGDVIDLVSYCLAGGSLSFKDKANRVRALQWLTQFLNLENLSSGTRTKALQAARRHEQERASETEQLAKKQRSAYRTFMSGRPLAGTLADTYLRGRGIELDKIPNLEGDLRFLDRQEYFLLRDRQRGEPGPSFPAIISAFRDATGRFVGAHWTFLAPDGSGKAPVSRAKLIWPAFSGAVIRLTRGASGLRVEDAIAAGVRESVQLYEGIEDGLSGAMVAPDVRAWAAGALGNIGDVPTPACVDSVLLHRQNDWSSMSAVTAFENAKFKLQNRGLLVAEIKTFEGYRDMNDMVANG